MNNLKSEDDWTNNFAITESDLNILARDIELASEAQEVTALARNFIRRRLLYGPQEGSTHIARDGRDGTSVQWWDQAENIKVGDHLYFLKSVDGQPVAYLGEVKEVRGGLIYVFLPDIKSEVRYHLNPRESSKWISFVANYQRIREEIRRKAAEQQFDKANPETIDLIMLEYGDRIVASLLNALAEDSRFVRLSGRWFLRELALKPTEKQIEAMAWSLFRADRPMLTHELADEITPVATEDRWLFGVYLALREHSELFENIDPGPQPRWQLVGPPTGSFIPKQAAYDPDTYEVICRPGVEAANSIVQRLWDLKLLDAVI